MNRMAFLLLVASPSVGLYRDVERAGAEIDSAATKFAECWPKSRSARRQAPGLEGFRPATFGNNGPAAVAAPRAADISRCG